MMVKVHLALYLGCLLKSGVVAAVGDEAGVLSVVDEKQHITRHWVTMKR